MAALEPGRTLSHYRILDTLGQGGQATAYKAEDQRLSRPVVIKTLRPELAASPSARRRFEREACLCSALEHPNICAIYDIGEHDQLFYIVMQYVDGPTLKELLKGRPLPVPDALSIAIQIADALAVAHGQGIIHRDIKPANVIVTPSGQAKVLDFGLAKMLAGDSSPPEDGNDSDEPLTEVGVPYGSMGYGSPEQASGDKVDHRSDIFSLGVVLYEMLTGQAPFKGRHRIDVLRAVINETPRPIVQHNPKAPAGLQPILDRALAKSAGERFQTMAAMRDELKAQMRRLSQGAGPEPVREPPRPRSPWPFGGTLGRVFGRLRGSVPGPSEPRASARPPSWGTETKKTIAVLPFRNVSGDAAYGFYEFSLADAIITELGQLRSLVVRPSSYIAQYTGLNADPRQVGEELAVGYVLAGSFIKAPERFRVTAQLIAAASGEIVWSEKIDIGARDLIAIQDTISERVIAGLRLKLSPEEQERIERRPTASAEAYEFYLRGRDLLFGYILKTFAVDDLETAVRMFNEATGLDPDFAAAHAALGRCYIHHAQGYGGPEYYLLAERSLRRALELDAASTEAQLQMIYVDLHQGDKVRARETIADLMGRAPNDPAVISVAAQLYRLDGLYERSLEQYDRLLDLNPKDVVLVSYNRARIYTHQQRYAEAIAELERARAVEPEHPLVKTFLAIALFNQGRLGPAQEVVEEVLRQHPHLDGVQPVLAWCLSARGEHERARGLITDRVREAAAADHDIAFWLASFYGMEAMADEAIEWIQRAVRLGNENYPLFAGSPKLESLRGDSRFVELMDDLKRRWKGRR